MPRRSDFWVFNIRQINWEYCVQGPSDSDRHGEENVGNPWFGKQSKSPPSIREGDLIFARRTTRAKQGQQGERPYGVMGIWEYCDRSRVESDDELPWTGGPYNWVLYLREIQQFDSPYQENYDELPFGYRSLQSDTIGLRPEYARGYFESLERHGFLDDQTQERVEKRFGSILSEDTDTKSPTKTETYSTEAKRYTSTVDRRLRNSQIVKELKEAHSDECQVCGCRRLQGREEGYSEVHHLKPLGRPHVGPDIKKNMLVLCPNHHADFDNGVISVDPRNGEISHLYEEEVVGNILTKANRVSDEHLRYHNENISVI